MSSPPSQEHPSPRPGGREDVARLLDELIQKVTEGTRGGARRRSAFEEKRTWPEQWEMLRNEALALIRMTDQKNKRAASRRKSMMKNKRRGSIEHRFGKGR